MQNKTRDEILKGFAEEFKALGALVRNLLESLMREERAMTSSTDDAQGGRSFLWGARRLRGFAEVQMGGYHADRIQ